MTTARAPSFFTRLQRVGENIQDSEDQRLQKRIFITALYPLMIATFIWGSIYAVYGELESSLISFGYFGVTLLSLFIIRRTRSVRFFLPFQLVLGLLLPFAHNLILGGIAASGGVVLWSLLSPLSSIIYYRPAVSARWWMAGFFVIVLAVVLPPFIRLENTLPPALVNVFFITNITGISLIIFLILSFLINQKDDAFRLLRAEQEKSENLLLNVLPREIAVQLKNGSRSIANQFEEVSILFADLVGFTPLTARMAPIEMVNLLNEIFSHFDHLVEKYGLEKIRTIGDSYMVASGVPLPRPDHASALVRMALEMRDYLAQLPPVDGKPVEFRIGINSGPVVGGVIGRQKFVYDVWGDAVNVASRMESHGLANQIQVTGATRALMGDEFECTPRGKIWIKGKGEIETWLVSAKKVTPIEIFVTNE